MFINKAGVLTPHHTGPNQTDKTRKAYVLQYALEGVQKLITKAGADYKFWASAQMKFNGQQKTGKVEVSQPDTAGGPSPEYILQNDPKKQFLILQNNKPPKS